MFIISGFVSDRINQHNFYYFNLKAENVKANVKTNIKKDHQDIPARVLDDVVVQSFDSCTTLLLGVMLVELAQKAATYILS